MSDTQQIKDNLDIVDFISEYVQLKPAGNNHKGLCPFHNEKSPSFMVSRERQSWRCFGCSKGGDIFTFVQEIEGLEFVEALKLLADKAGVTLTRSFDGNSKAGEKKVRLKSIMEEAVRFYHQFLLKMDAAAEARTYLNNRGLEPHTIDVWKIGFVPDQWYLLTQYLLKKGYAIDDMVDVGVTVQRDGADKRSGRGYYDRFRGRIMFPIHDAQGNAVGVTGRVLVETEKSGGKYVNTPQTDIFDKSRLLFGLDKAKAAIREHDEVVVVEGQMDVISVWQSGMENVVASSGTALTEHQINLMKRYTKNIVMAFDTDKAGLAAAKRGIGLALEAGMRVRVIQIPEDIAKDPDECIKKDPAVWKSSVQHAKEILAWYIDLAMSQHDLQSPRGKQAIVDDVLPEIARIPYAVEKDHWLGELSARTGIDRAVLVEDMQRIIQEKSFGTVRSTKEPIVTASVQEKKILQATQLERLIKEWFALVLANQELSISAFPAIRALDELNEPVRTLYESAKIVYDAEHQLPLKKLESDQTSELISTLILQGSHHFDDTDTVSQQKELEQLTDRIIQTDENAYRSGLITALAQAEKIGDTETVRKILSQLQ